MIKYKELVYNEKDIRNLYLSNEWYAYTNDINTLFDGVINSLYIYAAYDDAKLIGLIRVVGDGSTIIYIQDILVLPEYHRRGVGTVLLKHITDRYCKVRQIVLMTDTTEKQIQFYEKNKFVKMTVCNAVGFVYKK